VAGTDPTDPALVESAIAATESEFRLPTDHDGLRSRVFIFCATFRMASETFGAAEAHERLMTAMELLVGAGRELELSDREKAEMGLATIQTALEMTHEHPSPAEVDKALAEIAALAARSSEGG
jgi:hypothetical protein